MKKSLVLCLCCILALPLKTSAYSPYADDNPFVEAMLRMMEIFGLIDRDSLPLGVPYMAGYGQQMAPGFGSMGGFPGMSPMSGLGSVPGMSPLSGFGGVPGMSPLSGFGGVPGISGMGAYPGAATIPGSSGWPGGLFPGAGGMPGNRNGPAFRGQGATNSARGRLDGVWELENGTLVIIQGEMARLYLSREQYQDFAVRYDRQRLWWKPIEGGAASRYLYQIRDGRMILSDGEGKLLLMRRRR